MPFNCTICNKLYSSYNSLWNHKKKFHPIGSHLGSHLGSHPVVIGSHLGSHPVVIGSHLGSHPVVIGSRALSDANAPERTKSGPSEIKLFTHLCKYCKKIFQNRSNRWRHEQKCKEEALLSEEKSPDASNANKEATQREIELKIAKENNIRLKEEAKILKLKLKLQNSNKIEKPTLRKLNDLLLKQQNRIKNSTINSNNSNNITNLHNTNIQNNNNIVNNNFQLIGFDKEHYLNQVLTQQEKQMIVNSKFCSLEKIIEIVHCGKYNQFKNVIITNMKDNYMYKYDDKKGIFILSKKADVMHMLLEYRMGDLEIIYNELLENNKIDERTKSCIERFINQINYDTEKFKYSEGETYDNFRQFKINEIKVLLFNNTDKIMSDVSLLLSTEETQLENEMSEGRRPGEI